MISQQPREQFQRELSQFRRLNKLVAQYCKNQTDENFRNVGRHLDDIGQAGEAGQTGQTQAGSSWLSKETEFASSPSCFCKKMARSEGQYIEYFRDKFPSYYFSKSLRKIYEIGDRKYKGC